MLHCRSDNQWASGLERLGQGWTKIHDPDHNLFADELESNGVLGKYSIPAILFSKTEKNHEDWKFPLLPEEVAQLCSFGKVVTYRQKKYVVVQDEDEEVRLSPIEYFDMDR